jgi:hypothetical protein
MKLKFKLSVDDFKLGGFSSDYELSELFITTTSILLERFDVVMYFGDNKIVKYKNNLEDYLEKEKENENELELRNKR